MDGKPGQFGHTAATAGNAYPAAAAATTRITVTFCSCDSGFDGSTYPALTTRKNQSASR